MPHEKPSPLNLKSLREQVYDHLRHLMNIGGLSSGSFIDLNRLAEEIGVSRTPLRDALLQLETEGFVTILPRRGIQVAPLNLSDIRHLYEIIGALEGTAVCSAMPRMTAGDIQRLHKLNREMRQAVENDNFDRYYQKNLAFHGIFLEKCNNPRLKRIVETHKQRLYDWPRRRGFVREWEWSSTGEHETFIELLERGDERKAAEFLREVHWSFTVQERFIHQYYREAQRED